MADPKKLKLPPGATLVDDGNGGSMALPPGATLLSGPPSSDAMPGMAAVGKMDNFKAAPGLFSPGWFKEKAYNAADIATNALPAVGGIVGGAVGLASGGVPAVGGAALGGAGGEAARQLTRRALGFEDAPQTSLDAAKDIGKEALKQGAYEAGGQVMRGVGKAIAPKVAEAAIAPGKRLLKSIPENVNIGQTVLNESTAVNPGSIAKQLSQKIADASDQVTALTDEATRAGQTVSLKPARNLVAGELGSATAKNSPEYLRDVSKLGDQLRYQYDSTGKVLLHKPMIPISQPTGVLDEFGQPISTNALGEGPSVPVRLPATVDPARARALKQGIDMEITNWNPEAQANIAPLQERVRGAINSGFHKAVPEAAPLDAKMTSLIPTRDAAWNTSFNPGLTKNMFERFARPTGAALSTIYGAKTGYDEGGVAGGAVGGTAGLALPLMLSSPTGMMIGARVLNSKIGPGLFRIAAPLIEGEYGRDHKRK